MQISRRTSIWATLSAVPVLTVFAYAKTLSALPPNLASSPSIHASSHAASFIASRPVPALSAGRKSTRLVLKRGHVYQLSTAKMSLVVGASSSYHPGDVFTNAASFGASGEYSGNFSGWYITDSGGIIAASNSQVPSGWYVSGYNTATKTLTVKISPNAVPGDYLAFRKTGTTRYASLPDNDGRFKDSDTHTLVYQLPIGGEGPIDVGYIVGCTVD